MWTRANIEVITSYRNINTPLRSTWLKNRFNRLQARKPYLLFGFIGIRKPVFSFARPSILARLTIITPLFPPIPQPTDGGAYYSTGW